VTLDVHKKLPQYTEMMEILFTPVINNKDSLNILMYYLHSCIYFINISAISAPGKQNVNVTAPVVYTSGLNSVSFYCKVRLIANFSLANRLQISGIHCIMKTLFFSQKPGTKLGRNVD
jgi:hypothetical protein